MIKGGENVWTLTLKGLEQETGFKEFLLRELIVTLGTCC